MKQKINMFFADYGKQVMETESIQKNGMNLKSHTGKGNNKYAG
jgi:hypothetical protein